MSQQRDQLGRFVPGHPGGPGRPKRVRNRVYMNIVEEVISPEDWRAIVRKLKGIALHSDRDLDALKFLAPYLLGRPSTEAPVEDENENPDPTPRPPEPAELPAQAPLPMPNELSQVLEREENRDDEPSDNTTTKCLVLKGVARLRPYYRRT